MKYGLSEKQLEEIIAKISGFPEIDKAVLFGSRAIDTFKEASDVDIALNGAKVNAAFAAKLKFVFEEDTYLPFLFDFVAYRTIANEKLKEHINKKGVVIYRKKMSEHDLQNYKINTIKIKGNAVKENAHSIMDIRKSRKSCSDNGEGEGGMSEWKESVLDEIAIINPTESVSKGVKAKKIAMEMLTPFSKRVTGYSIEPYNGGMKFRNGDTIVARITPCLENGKTAYIDVLDKNEIGFGSTEYIVLREKENVTDKQFLYYFATSDEFRDVAILAMTGSSGRQRVEIDVVRNHTFLLPPLPEQRAIATVLSSLDDKIDLLHRQNKTLEAIAEALFRKWFVEPCKDGLPEGWSEGKLENIMNLSNGKSRPNTLGEIPVYGGNGILDYTDRYNFDGVSIIIGRVGAYCGSLFFENNKIWVSDNALHAKAKNSQENYFLFYLLKTLELNSYAEGSSHPLLTQTLLKSIDITIPPTEKREGYNSLMKMLNSKTITNQKSIRTLSKLRDTLLPKLMSGEVRVSV